MSSSPVQLPITGGCYCGNIRYESIAQPMMMIKCHCRDCQHITGGPYAPAVVLPITAFKLTKGELRYHFTNSLAGVNTNAGSVLNPVAASPELNQTKDLRRL